MLANQLNFLIILSAENDITRSLLRDKTICTYTFAVYIYNYYILTIIIFFTWQLCAMYKILQ